MRDVNYIEVYIEDFKNRKASWMFPETVTVNDVLRKWERGYLPFNREKVRVNGRVVDEKLMECQLNYFKEAGKRVEIRVSSIWPRKEDKKEGEAEKRVNGKRGKQDEEEKGQDLKGNFAPRSGTSARVSTQL